MEKERKQSSPINKFADVYLLLRFTQVILERVVLNGELCNNHRKTGGVNLWRAQSNGLRSAVSCTHRSSSNISDNNRQKENRESTKNSEADRESYSLDIRREFRAQKPWHFQNRSLKLHQTYIK